MIVWVTSPDTCRQMQQHLMYFPCPSDNLQSFISYNTVCHGVHISALTRVSFRELLVNPIPLKDIIKIHPYVSSRGNKNYAEIKNRTDNKRKEIDSACPLGAIHKLRHTLRGEVVDEV